MGKIFGVTSGKGGVGKSTVSTGLALTFSRSGKKVLLVDMDEGLRCLDLMLGIDENVVFDLSDILQGRDIADTAYKIGEDELYLVPAPAKLGMIDAFALANFAVSAQELYDIVIFDFPAGIDFSLYTVLPKNTIFLTVAFPDPVTVRDAAIVGEMLDNRGCAARLIINKFEYKLTKKKIYKNIDDIIDQSSIQLIGIVPKSSVLAKLSSAKKPNAKCKPMKAFERITKRLLGEHILLPKLKKI